ncbi:hypothetical protein COBT_002199, partial [Conglomerata obtusa]
MNERHGIDLESEFSKIVRPYFNKFETMKKNNLENIKNFAGNFMIHITYKSLNNEILKGIVKICDELNINDESISNTNVMYYALENIENNYHYKDVFIHYQTLIQKFVCFCIYNLISSDLFHTNNSNINKTCEFAKTFDINTFTDFFDKKHENYGNKSVFVDNCCKTKEDFLFFSRLYQSITVHLNRITNSITLLIKSDVNNKETKIMNLHELIYNNLDSFNQVGLEIYVSEINAFDDEYKIQVKKMVIDVEPKCTIFSSLVEPLSKEQNDFIYTLYPYSIDSDMSISYNQHEINKYKNLDTKLFDCDGGDDICNLRITLSNLFGSYEYLFVRMVEFIDENKLVVRYIGLYIDITENKKNEIWMCVEYIYVKQGKNYERRKIGDSNQIKNFFCMLESILMQNINSSTAYILIKHMGVNGTFINKNICAKFRVLKSDIMIYERLDRMFTKMIENEWKIEIINNRFDSLNYTKTFPNYKFYAPTLNVVDRSKTSQMWEEWPNIKIDNRKKSCIQILFARFTFTKLNPQIQFYMKIDINLAFMSELYCDNPYVKLKNQCKDYIKTEIKKSKIKYIRTETDNLDAYFDCNRLIDACLSILNPYNHESLLARPSLRKNYFKKKLCDYILVKSLNDKIVDKKTYEFIRTKYMHSSEYLQEDYNIYDTGTEKIEEKKTYSSASYFNEVRKHCFLTEDDAKIVDDCINIFCDIYKRLEESLPEAEKGYKGYFEFFLQFPTYFPQNLWGEFLEVLENSCGTIKNF